MIDLTAESSSEDSLITGPPLEIVEAPGSAPQGAAQVNDSPQSTTMPLTTATAPVSSMPLTTATARLVEGNFSDAS